MSKTVHRKVQNGPQLHPKWPTVKSKLKQSGKITWAVFDQAVGRFGHPRGVTLNNASDYQANRPP